MRKKNGKNRPRKKHIARRILLLLLAYILLGSFLPTLFHIDPDLPAAEADPACGPEYVLDLEDNTSALSWRLRLINSAQDEIILTTFDFGNDQSAKELISALNAASQRGVKVRVILDGLNMVRRQTFSREMKYLSRQPGVEIRSYHPVNLLTPWTLNYRMHDKYLIIDDSAYLLGGRNSNNLFLGNYQSRQNIDRDVVVVPQEEDASLTSLQEVKNYFEQIWSSPACKRYCRPLPAAQRNKTASELQQIYENLQTSYPEAFTQESLSQTAQQGFLSADSIRFISNSTRDGDKGACLWDQLQPVLSQSSSVVAETPYVICSRKMYDDLQQLSSDGRDVELVINAVESGANVFGCVDYLNEKSRLLSYDLTVYECICPQSMHGKAFLLDDDICIVGSSNMDIRSVYLDTETMLIIDSPGLHQNLENNLEQKKSYARIVSQSQPVSYGSHFPQKKVPAAKKIFYAILRVVSIPFRSLL